MYPQFSWAQRSASAWVTHGGARKSMSATPIPATIPSPYCATARSQRTLSVPRRSMTSSKS